VTREFAFILSPGDLDEVVQSFLLFGDPVGAKEATRGTSFERMGAFRTGFFEGEPACTALAGG
jgi:predicted metalloprotease